MYTLDDVLETVDFREQVNLRALVGRTVHVMDNETLGVCTVVGVCPPSLWTPPGERWRVHLGRGRSRWAVNVMRLRLISEVAPVVEPEYLPVGGTCGTETRRQRWQRASGDYERGLRAEPY